MCGSPSSRDGARQWNVAHSLRAASVIAALALVLPACSSSPPILGTPDLLRRTASGVLIEAAEVVEVVALPGCSLLAEPPQGGCEQEATFRHVQASIGGRSIEAQWQVPYCCLESIFLVDIVRRVSSPGLCLVSVSVADVVDTVQLVDEAGHILDRVHPSGAVVELAAPAEAVIVEALDAAGTVVGSCPPDGVLINGVTYQCTLAPGAEAPVTTIPEP